MNSKIKESEFSRFRNRIMKVSKHYFGFAHYFSLFNPKFSLRMIHHYYTESKSE